MSECPALTLPEVNKLITLVLLHMARYIEAMDDLDLRGLKVSVDHHRAAEAYDELDNILSKLLATKRELTK